MINILFQEAHSEHDRVDAAVDAAVDVAVNSALDVAVGDDENARDLAKMLINWDQTDNSRGAAVCGDSAAGGNEAAVSVAKRLVFSE